MGRALHWNLGDVQIVALPTTSSTLTPPNPRSSINNCCSYTDFFCGYSSFVLLPSESYQVRKPHAWQICKNSHRSTPVWSTCYHALDGQWRHDFILVVILFVDDIHLLISWGSGFLCPLFQQIDFLPQCVHAFHRNAWSYATPRRDKYNDKCIQISENLKPSKIIRRLNVPGTYRRGITMWMKTETPLNKFSVLNRRVGSSFQKLCQSYGIGKSVHQIWLLIWLSRG